MRGFQQRLQGLRSVFTPLESYVPNDLSRVWGMLRGAIAHVKRSIYGKTGILCLDWLHWRSPLPVGRVDLRALASGYIVHGFAIAQVFGFQAQCRLLVTYRISVSALAIMHSPRSADSDCPEGAVDSQIHPIP